MKIQDLNGKAYNCSHVQFKKKIQGSELPIYAFTHFLHLIKVILRSGKSDSPLCSFCKKRKKNKVSPFLYQKMKYLWDQLRKCTTNKTKIPSITPQSSMLYLMSPSHDYLLVNLLILTFKFYIFTSWNKQPWYGIFKSNYWMKMKILRKKLA